VIVSGVRGGVTLADLALVSALIYQDLRQVERDGRGQYTNLATWFDRIN
jgi:glutathione S-transferase